MGYVLALIDHFFGIITENRLLFHNLDHPEIVSESTLDEVLAFFDPATCGCTPIEQTTFLLFEHLDALLIVSDCLFVELDEFGNVFADSVGEDELAAEAVALVEFAAEASQLSHDLNKVALRFRILVLNALLLLLLLRQLLLQLEIFLERVRKFDLIFLNNAPTDLLMDRFAGRTQVLID